MNDLLMFGLKAPKSRMFGTLPKPTLGERLREAVDVADEAESAEFFKPNDGRWAETLTGEDSPTGRSRVYINDAKFKESGSTNYRDKMHTLDSLHVLKDIEPKRYKKLYSAAMSDPGYVNWAKESYGEMQKDPEFLEQRGFDDWHRKSRFDQVIGGYMMAGDKDIPTAKNWSRDLPYGDGLRSELELLEPDIWPDGYPRAD